MSIREKIYELLESIDSSAEILDQNITNWEGRELDRVPGNFVSDEITDPLNLDRNRLDDTLPIEVSGDSKDSSQVVDGSSIVIGVDSEEGEEEIQDNEENEEQDEEKSKEDDIDESYVYGESSFVEKINKLLKESESDVAGIKKYNMDARVAAYQVKNALNKLIPETASTGLQVEEYVHGNRGEEKDFVVLHCDDVDLPKELEVEVDGGSTTTLYLGKKSEDEPKAHHYFITEPEYK